MKAILLLIGMLFVGSAAAETQSNELMPAWQLKKQDGTIVKSSDYQGKPLILHFWATWCPYCKKLQPGLDKLSKQYQDQGLEVLGVSIQENVSAKPQTELEKRGLSLQTVVNGESLAFDVFDIKGTPTTIFIGPDGKILGSTMQSDPEDPQWETVAKYLVSLKAK